MKKLLIVLCVMFLFTGAKCGSEDNHGGVYASSNTGAQPIPEPITLFLMGSGAIGVFALRKKR